MDLAAEHVDPEDLSIVVALSESKAVALGCAIMASHTEQNLINRVVGDLCAGIGVQQPDKIDIKKLPFDILKVAAAGYVSTLV